MWNDHKEYRWKDHRQTDEEYDEGCCTFSATLIQIEHRDDHWNAPTDYPSPWHVTCLQNDNPKQPYKLSLRAAHRNQTHVQSNVVRQ